MLAKNSVGILAARENDNLTFIPRHSNGSACEFLVCDGKKLPVFGCQYKTFVMYKNLLLQFILVITTVVD
jgi:hypothetical protein